MIPKIIHYCWFGPKKIPVQQQNFIKGWKKLLPDYQFILWNEDNFDVNSAQWTRAAYDCGKYAFVSDFVRCLVLSKYGGFYLDTDVELLKSLDFFVGLPYVLATDATAHYIIGSIIAVNTGEKFIQEILDYYQKEIFVNDKSFIETHTIPMIFERVLKNHYDFVIVNNIREFGQARGCLFVFAPDFFSPQNNIDGSIHLTENTVAFDHYAGSWLPWYKKIKNRLKKIVGPDVTRRLQIIKKKLKDPFD